MCHAKFQWVEPEERQEPPPTTMQQYVAYNQQQWLYYNELFAEIHHGIYGQYYNFLIDELIDGPYWSSIKAQLGQVQEEYDPEASVSGTREPQPTDTSSDSTNSDSEDDWEYAVDILATKSA